MSPHRSGSKGSAEESRRLDQANRSRDPKRKARPTGERERVRDTRTPLRRASDRSVRLLQLGVRHRAGLLGWIGIAGLCATMMIFSGVTQVVAGGASLAAMGAGAAIAHHERTRTLNSDTTHTATRAEIRAHHDAMARAGQRPRPDVSGDTVRVKSHTNAGHGVKTHTRKKAGTSGNGSTGGAAKPAPKCAPKPPAKKPPSKKAS